MSEKSMHKINYLEGLRGISCMIVIFDHLVNDFYPSLRFTGTPGIIGDIKDIIAWSPLNLMYSGLIPVFIFFVLSGYVLSYKYHATKDLSVVTSAAIKRYFRLLLPVLASLVFLWLIYFFIEMIYGDESPVTITSIIIAAFYNVFFTGQGVINGPLWTMSIELLGSFLVFGLLLASHNLKHRWLVYLIALVLSFNTSYFLFIFGVIICDSYTSGYASNFVKVKNKFANIFMFSISLLLMSYPMSRNGVDIGWYRHMTFDAGFNVAAFWHLMGVCLFFYSMMNISWLIKLFDTKVALFLGKISLSAYVLHFPIILLVKRILSAETGLLSLILASLMVITSTMMISVFFERYIDRKSVAFSNAIARMIRG